MPLLSERPIVSIHCQLESILKFGVTPYGERRIINILAWRGQSPAAATPSIETTLPRARTAGRDS